MLVYNEGNHSVFFCVWVDGCTICSWMGEVIFVFGTPNYVRMDARISVVDDLGILEVRKKSVVYIHNLTSDVDVFNPIWLNFPHFSRVTSAIC